MKFLSGKIMPSANHFLKANSMNWNYINILKKRHERLSYLRKLCHMAVCLLSHMTLCLSSQKGRLGTNYQEKSKKSNTRMRIKQERQQEIENDKKWSKMNDENDEIISRLNRLKPVEPVVEQDIEYFDRMDELEQQRDEYFEEKDRRERAKYFDKRAKIKKRRNK